MAREWDSERGEFQQDYRKLCKGSEIRFTSFCITSSYAVFHTENSFFIFFINLWRNISEYKT